MKKYLISSLFLISILMLNCEKNSENEVNEYKIVSGACGKIVLKSKIGNDFYSALDSLIIIREPYVTGGCPGNPCYSSYIEVDTFGIDFDNDNREFIGISFKDSLTDTHIFSTSDVIDSYGNYYIINWCLD